MPTTLNTELELGTKNDVKPSLGPKVFGKRLRKRRKVTKSDSLATENAATLPKPPGNKIRDPQKLFDYWIKVNEDHPDRLQLYVYRTWPIIDRKRLNKDTNIGILTQPTNT